MKRPSDFESSRVLDLLNSDEGVAKLSQLSAQHLRGALATQRDLRFNFPGLYYAITPPGETDKQRRRREAEEAEMAREHRYAVYPLEHERHRCYTCGGPTFKYHKCRGCRGDE